MIQNFTYIAFADSTHCYDIPREVQEAYITSQPFVIEAKQCMTSFMNNRYEHHHQALEKERWSSSTGGMKLQVKYHGYVLKKSVTK